MKITLLIISSALIISCGSKKHTMKCDAYNGAHSEMKYKKWYKKR